MIEIGKGENFYKQEYCGCAFSRQNTRRVAARRGLIRMGPNSMALMLRRRMPAPDESAPVQHTVWHPLPRMFRALAAQTSGSVLLETAKQDGNRDRSFLFLDPVEELVAWTSFDLDKLLSVVDRRVEEGLYLAGFFSYECGEHFLGLPPRILGAGQLHNPIARLGVFRAPIEFDHSTGGVLGKLPLSQLTEPAQNDHAGISVSGLQILQAEYNAAIARIHEYLAAGDTYQVNFTDKVNGGTDSKPLDVYESLLRQQPVPFAAFLNDPGGPIFSFSPELFFRTSEGVIQVRPMKGTWSRGRDMDEDEAAEKRLRTDEKNRSEHVMIVDLLRNDLGRICQYGSVTVEKLFHVERYTTLLQMTSTCSGKLREDVRLSKVFSSMFPSGSITGAPKLRAMEIIRELEQGPRGVYTGAIGYFGPNSESCFNVAIRTLTLQHGELSMGVGGAITADSKPEEEFEECTLKAAFLTKQRPPFSLFETMRCEAGIPLLPLHMERLWQSARYFGILYDAKHLLAEIKSAAANCSAAPSRVRVELNEDGQWTIVATPLDSVPWSGRLLVAKERTQSADPFLRHKTTNRDIYNRALVDARQSGFDEVLFFNEQGHLTEGAISNIFLRTGAVWSTPALDRGVLAGIKRSELIETMPDIEQGVIRIADLQQADQIILCNALRGIRPVYAIEASDGAAIWRGE